MRELSNVGIDMMRLSINEIISQRGFKNFFLGLRKMGCDNFPNGG